MPCSCLLGLYDTVNGTAVLPALPALPPAPAAGAALNVTAAECAADPRCYFAVSWNRTLQYMFIYHFFGLLWGHQFIVGVGCASGHRPPMPPNRRALSSQWPCRLRRASSKNAKRSAQRPDWQVSVWCIGRAPSSE